jgi:hypothetical protein
VLAVMNCSFYVAIDRLPLGTVAAIEFLPVIVLAALGARTPRNAGALLLAVPGVYLLTDVQLAGEPLGVAVAFVNAALFALYIVLGHRVAQRGAASGIDGLGASMLIAAVAVTPLAGWAAVPAALDPVALLDDVEALSWQGTELTWRPLRGVLGTRIVGMAAFTAERAGQEVVEGHAESDGGRGHEEVYVVLDGRATFTLDGAELDAPAGMFIRVDPQVHRRAVAAEPGTTVLALGDAPVFVPSASEWIERARAHARTDPPRARAILDELRAVRPESPGVGPLLQ